MIKATISLAPDGRLLCEFPRTEGFAAHEVLLQPTTAGLKHLIEMLSYQDRNIGKLATKGAPTQAIIDAWVEEKERKDLAQSLEYAKGVDL